MARRIRQSHTPRRQDRGVEGQDQGPAGRHTTCSARNISEREFSPPGSHKSIPERQTFAVIARQSYWGCRPSEARRGRREPGRGPAVSAIIRVHHAIAQASTTIDTTDTPVQVPGLRHAHRHQSDLLPTLRVRSERQCRCQRRINDPHTNAHNSTTSRQSTLYTATGIPLRQRTLRSSTLSGSHRSPRRCASTAQRCPRTWNRQAWKIQRWRWRWRWWW